jgi:hypothetical protein
MAFAQKEKKRLRLLALIKEKPKDEIYIGLPCTALAQMQLYCSFGSQWSGSQCDSDILALQVF